MHLKHKDTGKWLSMSKKTYPRPIAGQHEVAAAARKDSNTAWRATEGAYFPPPGTKPDPDGEL